VLSPRAEGPAVSSHARQGVVCGADDMEVRRTGTPACVAPSALLLSNARLIPAFTAGPNLCRPFGPQLPKIHHRSCE
jgi:hypothetical protein